MKSVKFLILLLILPVLTYSQVGPKLEVVGGETINTGDHIRGKEVHYEIKFKNIGDADLKISGVQTSCGCSTALATSDLVKPGDEGSVNFTFNGNGFGAVAKNVFITTNETPNNSHTLLISMNMLDPLTLNPASIISSGKVGEELTQTATLLNSLDKEVTISEVSANSPVVKVTSDKTTIGSGESASFSISIKIFEDSPVNAAVIIKTSEGEYQIPILVDIKAN
jgi:hypothetical protein